MAQQKKKTTTTKKKTTGSSRSSSSGKRTAKKNQKRPIRREVAGAILLVLALCLGFSYFQSGAWLLDQPAKLCRSLFGWGYYLVAPALFVAFQALQEKFKPIQWKDPDSSELDAEMQDLIK